MTQEAKSNVVLVVASGLMLVAIVGIVAEVVIGTLTELVKLAAATIAAASAILIAILNHTFAIVRAKADERRQLKQQNYVDLIKRLAPYFRTRRGDKDEFETAHMQTWVVGSSEVVELTTELMKQAENKNIKALLLAMRADIGLEIEELKKLKPKFLEPQEQEKPGSPGDVGPTTGKQSSSDED